MIESQAVGSTSRNVGRGFIGAIVVGVFGTIGFGQAPTPKLIPNDGVIDEAGHYYLERDMLVEREAGLRVLADDVLIDLRGHALRFNGDPRPGVYGVVSSNRKGVTVRNGVIGGFWFGTHCTQNSRLRIHDVTFDDIPYLAINVAQSSDVRICDNEFLNFRYDVKRSAKDHYVIGINIGAEDVVISGNRFDAHYAGNSPHEMGVETVFVLFSANVSQRCVVTHNTMKANVVLDRSYGIWVASNSQTVVTHNTVHNMKFGITLAREASGIVGFNRFSADPPPSEAMRVATAGISSSAPKRIFVAENEFDGVDAPMKLPEDGGAVIY